MDHRRFFSLRGHMRSGTNWLGGLLNTHLDIGCYGEYHWQSVVQAMDLVVEQQPIYAETEYRRQARRELEEMIRRTLIHRDPESPVLGERTPHTLSPLVWPDAPQITIVRDGRDVLVSRAFHLHAHPEVHRLFQREPELAKEQQNFLDDPWYFHQHPDRLLSNETMVRESVRSWRMHMESDRETCAKNPELRVFTVRYEDLSDDVELWRRRLFDFLDVDLERCEPIEFELRPGISEEQPTEMRRKGVVGDWQNYFTDQAAEWFWGEVGDEMALLGYE